MPDKSKDTLKSLKQGLVLFRKQEEQKIAARREAIQERAGVLMHKTGDMVEQSISNRIEGTQLEAPILLGKPEEHKWYRIPLSEGLSGDGSEYHIYLKKGTTDHLCIFFSGGGVAWNEYTAARPVTGGRVAAGEPNFYWNNLRPFTQIMNINIGITEAGKERNPFNDWNFVVITYATGDFHVGNNEFPYKDQDGTRKILQISST